MTYPALEQHSFRPQTVPKPVPHRPACRLSRERLKSVLHGDAMEKPTRKAIRRVVDFMMRV